MAILSLRLSISMRLAIIVYLASFLALISTRSANSPLEGRKHHNEKRSVTNKPASANQSSTTASRNSVQNAPNKTASSTNNPRECQKLPITNGTWKLLDIDNSLKKLPGGQNLTIIQYATMNGGGNFICGIGETCNAGQLCHPVKAPAWQVLYAAQEYNNFMNAMVTSMNNAMSSLQAVSASMVNDLFENVTDSRFMVNLKFIFTDMYRGIAYGAATLFVITFIGFPLLDAILAMSDILVLTAIGAGLAAWIQGAPKTVSFVPWTKLSFYVAQAQEKLTSHITHAMAETLRSGINSEKGLAKILKGGAFFHPPAPSGISDTMEKGIMRVVQGRLLARMLRDNNAFVTISVDECKGTGPGGARGDTDTLSYCDPNEKLLYNVIRAHKKKTINTIHNAAAIINKYGFSAEFIVKTSWQCQTKYGRFEHDTFAEMDKVSPSDLMSTDCVINLPVCDMRLPQVRGLKFDRNKTTVVACRKGAGLPI